MSVSISRNSSPGAAHRDIRCAVGGVCAIASFCVALLFALTTTMNMAPYASSYAGTNLYIVLFVSIVLRLIPFLPLGIGGVLCKRRLIMGSNIFCLVEMALLALGSLLQQGLLSSVSGVTMLLGVLFALAGSALLLVLMVRSSPNPLSVGIKALPGILMFAPAVFYLVDSIFAYSTAGYSAEMIFASGIAAALTFGLLPYVLGAIAYLLIGTSSVVEKPMPITTGIPTPVQTVAQPGTWPQGQSGVQAPVRPAVQPVARPVAQPRSAVQPAMQPAAQPRHTQSANAIQPQRTSSIAEPRPVSSAASTASSNQSTAIRYCRGCGRPLDPQEKFCYKCGTQAP